MQTIKGIEYAFFTAAAGNFAATFATDATPPAVSQHTPAANAEAVPLRTNITVQFNEPMSPATINATTIRLRAEGAASDVAATVTWHRETRTATLDPGANLAKGIVYGVTVDRSVADVAGNALGSELPGRSGRWNSVAPAPSGARRSRPARRRTLTRPLVNWG